MTLVGAGDPSGGNRLEGGQADVSRPGRRAHFESLCRDFALDAEEAVFGEFPAEIGSGVVPDPANRTQIEIDVVALAAQEPGRPRRILSLGEAKWGEVMGRQHLERLARARDLLQRKGYDTRDTVLACYGGAGFTDEARMSADDDARVRLIGLERLYRR